MNDKTPIQMEDLSFDARVLAGSWFGLGMRSTVTLHLLESQPTARTRAAIDELVAKGVVGIEPFNELGGLVHRPLVDCSDAANWLRRLVIEKGRSSEISWSLYEPIDEERAYELMTPFGKGVWAGEKRGARPRDNPFAKDTHAEDHARWEKGRRAATRR